MALLGRIAWAITAGLALPGAMVAQRPPPMPGPPVSQARLLGPPPAALQISFANRGVMLVWQGVADPAGYRVYRTADPAVAPTELTTAPIAEPKFLDLSATPGNVYYYSVAADYVDRRLGTSAPVAFGVPISTRGGGLVSPPISAAPAGLPASPPNNLKASATPVAVTLNWNPALSAQSYEVVRVGPGAQSTVLTQPAFPLLATTFTDRGVQPGISYRYDVSALGSRGDRATVQTTIVPPQPVNPVGLTSAVQLYNIPSQMTPTLNVLLTVNGTVTVSWQPVPGATSYRVAGPNINQYRQVTGTSTAIGQVPPGAAKYTVVADFTNGYNQRFGNDQAPASITVQVGSLPVQGFGPTQDGGGAFQWYDQTGATGFHLFYADRPGGPYVEGTDAIGPTWGYHRELGDAGRSFWYKVVSTFPNAPAAITDPPLLVCKKGQHNVTGLEVVQAQAGAVKIRWHPICFAWYHVYTPSGDVVIPEANWLSSEFTDPNTPGGKSYGYNVCATRIEPYTSVFSNTSKCAQITVAVP